MALQANGYRGAIYPVNPKYATVDELRCYPSLSAVPRPCDVAIVAVPGKIVPDVIRECGAARIPYAIVFSAGFKELGARGAEAQSQLEQAIRSSGVRVVGPNCQGLMNIRDRVMCGFGSSFMNPALQPGELAMVSQSGGFGYGVVAQAQYAGVGFTYVVSAGNESDLDTLDFLEYFVEQDEIKMVSTYIEGIRDGSRLRRIGRRALELGKPILVWKVGNTERGKRAAASHTANLTSDYELYRTAFAEGAFLQIYEIDDLVDVARAFRAGKLPPGDRVAIITISGGAGVLFADECEKNGLELASLSEATLSELRTFLPDYVSLENPFDLTGQAINDAMQFNRTLTLIANDPNVDMIMMRTSQALTMGKQLAEYARVMEATGKPILIVWGAAPDPNAEGIRELEEAKISWHTSPGRATRAAVALATFSRRVRNAPLTQAPEPLHKTVAVPRTTKVVGELEAKRWLRALGIATVTETLLTQPEIEALTELPVPSPLVAKVNSPDIFHKSELGGVRLNIADLSELKRSVAAIEAAVRKHEPRARIDGFLIQEQVVGTELIVGVKNDACFGPTVLLGLGGIFTEVMKDVVYRFAPFGEDTARAMVHELRGRVLLNGYRGQPPADIEAVVRMLVVVSCIADAYRDEIAEIDLNPVIVRAAGEGAVAADALIVLKDV